LETDFERNPVQAGWVGLGSPSRPFDGVWSRENAHGGKGSISVTWGGWDSPAFPVKPFQLYRITFASKAERQGYWLVRSFEAGGPELWSDSYSSVYESGEWLGNEVYFTGRADSAWARLGFRPINGALCIDDVRVRPASRQEALCWADALYGSMPPLDCPLAPDRLKHLSRALEKLRTGPKLRIVILGDSIANDLGNSLFHLLLERKYPKCRIEVVHSIRGGTGCRYFQQEGRVKPLVVDYTPDLLIVGGISHDLDAEAFRSVIHQVRQATPVDILIFNGAVIENGLDAYWHQRGGLTPEAKAKALAANARFTERLRTMADEEKAAFLDTRGLWDAYIEQSSRPLDWYQRDWVHANERGKQVLGRMLERFFAPGGR
jgi:lysophospholipase L1-like esterase